MLVKTLSQVKVLTEIQVQVSFPAGIGLRCNHSIGRRDSSDLVC
jgi:hypothetical protein